MKTLITTLAAIVLSGHVAATAAVNAGNPGDEQVLINNPAVDAAETGTVHTAGYYGTYCEWEYVWNGYYYAYRWICI